MSKNSMVINARLSAMKLYFALTKAIIYPDELKALHNDVAKSLNPILKRGGIIKVAEPTPSELEEHRRKCGKGVRHEGRDGVVVFKRVNIFRR